MHVPVVVVLVECGMRPVYQLDDVGLDANVSQGELLVLLRSRVLLAAIIVEQDLVDVDRSLVPPIGWHLVIPIKVVQAGCIQRVR